MHISCPDCAMIYEVPDAQLKPGRRLRCANCGTQWAPTAATAAAFAAAPAVQPPSPPEHPFEPPVAASAEPPPPPAPQPEPAPQLAENPAAASSSSSSGTPSGTSSGTSSGTTTAAPPARTAPALQAPAMVERPIRLIPEGHPAVRASRQSVLPLVLAWALTLAVVGAGGWGAYQYRSRVIQAWPPSERAYAALGLD